MGNPVSPLRIEPLPPLAVADGEVPKIPKINSKTLNIKKYMALKH